MHDLQMHSNHVASDYDVLARLQYEHPQSDQESYA